MLSLVVAKPRVCRQASHSGVVTSVAFSPDGSLLASGSWDGTIKIWDIRDGKLKLKRTLGGAWDEVEAVAFSPDGRSIAGLGAGFDSAPYSIVALWPLDQSRGRILIREEGKIDALAFAPDGTTLATGDGDRRAVTLWDIPTGKRRAELPGHCGPIWSVAYSPDGRALAAACGVVPASVELDGSRRPAGDVRLWNLSEAEPKPRARLISHEYGVVSVAFSPDGGKLASGGFDRAVKLWNAETGLEQATLLGHEGWVSAVAFSPDGSVLASGSHDQTIKLWDAATGYELAGLSGHLGNVYSLAFSPDGSTLASGSLDATVRLWDAARALD